MPVSLAELSDETRVACRAFMRDRFKSNNPPVPITMGRAMGDGGGYGFGSTDILALLEYVQARVRALPNFRAHAENIHIASGAALPGLVAKTLSGVADHAVKSIATSLKAGGVVLV
jgi:hypothetical protein